jgi:multiple sugar transport system permease protein
MNWQTAPDTAIVSIQVCRAGGGPARATQTLSLLVYEEAFQFFRFGYASAVGMLLLAACAILSFLSIRWSRPPGS